VSARIGQTTEGEAADDLVRSRILVVAILTLVAAGGAVDLVLDDPEEWLSAHVVFELGLVTASLGLAVWLWRGWSRTDRALGTTRRLLEERREERDAWRARARSALEGLGEAIDRQFDEWGLTPTEREVALFLLKGYSHKEIAGMTARSERTVRQHAGVVYGKAGLAGGRAGLAAFFLEDLMLPAAARREEGERT
jgi:DNA-binding CsgD family transcriptional regulator